MKLTIDPTHVDAFINAIEVVMAERTGGDTLEVEGPVAGPGSSLVSVHLRPADPDAKVRSRCIAFGRLSA